MEEKLIEAVRAFPCLWQVSSKGYKDLRVKENAWKEVASRVGEVTIDDCTRRWKGLRDKFVRELKKMKKRKTGDEGPAYVSCWPYFQSLMFLSDSVKHRSTSSNFGNSTALEKESAHNDHDENLLEDDEIFNESSSLTGPLSPRSAITETNGNSSSSCPSPATSMTQTPSVKPHPSAKKRKAKQEDIDELLVKSLYSLQDSKKAKTEQMDEEEHYGQQIAQSSKTESKAESSCKDENSRIAF